MPAELQPLLQQHDIENTVVYPILHAIREDVIHFIDTPLSYEALTAPDLTYTLVRPLFEKYCAFQRAGNMAVVFCLLLNRVYFDRDRTIATASVSRSRATLCEILATRIFKEESHSLYKLTVILTTTWAVYSGANPSVVDYARQQGKDDDLEERVGNAIELAILGKAKRFIKSSSCQKVIDGIWTGKCVYQSENSHSILSDTYKRRPVHFYDPLKAPLLNHYRLKVPAVRSVLEYINFLILFILFVFAIEFNDVSTLNVPEIIFMIYALGFTLEKTAAMQEHGIKVYFRGTWNFFDLALVTTYLLYATLRVYGVVHDRLWARELGIDFLAIIACLLFPRLAFVTLRNNLMVLSLRAMMMQFMILMLIAAFCFCGFLYALWTLSRTEAGYPLGTIAWWMLDLWFGLDASGFHQATDFHPVMGPVLMVTYACLSNTLLLTVLVSILSNTFTKINEDAAAEALFRRAVSTIEGVKADSLFSYQPPINLLAVFTLLPMSFILSPRWFHKVNVFMIRATSFPILISISLYERFSKKNGTSTFYETVSVAAEKVHDALPRPLKRLSIFERLAGSSSTIDSIFEIQEELDESALDTADLEAVNNGGFQLSLPQRRLSPFSMATRPPETTSPTKPPPSSTPPPRTSPVSMRTRVNSQAAREGAPQSFTSPLAQIYQPLIVDPEEPDSPEMPLSPPSAASGVSYGPASRRRLSSIHSVHRRATTDHHPYSHHHGSSSHQLLDVSFKNFPPLSESPSSLQGTNNQQEPPSAEQIKAEELNGEEPTRLIDAVTAIQKRQERIEGMLEKLLEGMQGEKLSGR